MCEIKEFGPVVFLENLCSHDQEWVALAYHHIIKLPITQSEFIQQRPFEQTYKISTPGAFLCNIKQFG